MYPVAPALTETLNPQRLDLPGMHCSIDERSLKGINKMVLFRINGGTECFVQSVDNRLNLANSIVVIARSFVVVFDMKRPS